MEPDRESPVVHEQEARSGRANGAGRKALITGITGQDGSYLAEFLLSKGYEVHGIIRRASTFNTGRIDHIYQDPHESDTRLFLHYGDLSNPEQITALISKLKPDEIYQLGAQSHVRTSFDIPVYTGDVTGLGAARVLEALRLSGIPARMYQASSSEMFGAAKAPQSERTPLGPRSPYAAAKAYAYWMAVTYRDGYGLFVSNGILFNHESPRRSETFLTRKVTTAAAQIRAGRRQKVYLGNLDARRDWGYAPEYVEVMWELLQRPKPGDFVIGTGESHSVREFVMEAFSYAGLDWEQHVEIDPRYFRPNEVDHMRADPTKARKVLGWSPKVGFRELVRIMVDADLEREGVPTVGEGKAILRERFDGWHQWDAATLGMPVGSASRVVQG